MWVWVCMGDASPNYRTRTAVCGVTRWMSMGDMVVEYWKREISWCVIAEVACSDCPEPHPNAPEQHVVH